MATVTPATRRAYELLHGALNRYSPSGYEKEVAQYFVAALEDRGFSARIDSAGNAIGEIGTGSRTVLLVGHLDTRPGWVEPVLQQGLLFGRGVVDGKGPLSAFVEGASDLASSVLERLRIVFLGAVEALDGSSKGFLHALPQYRPEAILVAEAGGWSSVTVGRKGSMELSFHAETASEAPFDGPTASERGVRFWSEIDHFCRHEGKAGSEWESIEARLRRIEGGAVPGDRVDVRIDLSLPPDPPLARIREICQRAAADHRGTFMSRGELPAVRVPDDLPMLRCLTRAITDLEGTPKLEARDRASSMNLAQRLHPGVAVLGFGPGDPRQAGAPTEQVPLDDYTRSIQVLRRALATLSELPGS